MNWFKDKICYFSLLSSLSLLKDQEKIDEIESLIATLYYRNNIKPNTSNSQSSTANSSVHNSTFSVTNSALNGSNATDPAAGTTQNNAKVPIVDKDARKIASQFYETFRLPTETFMELLTQSKNNRKPTKFIIKKRINLNN